MCSASRAEVSTLGETFRGPFWGDGETEGWQGAQQGRRPPLGNHLAPEGAGFPVPAGHHQRQEHGLPLTAVPLHQAQRGAASWRAVRQQAHWHRAFWKAELTLPGVGSACRAPRMLLPDRDHPLPSQDPQATVLERLLPTSWGRSGLQVRESKPKTHLHPACTGHPSSPHLPWLCRVPVPPVPCAGSEGSLETDPGKGCLDSPHQRVGVSLVAQMVKNLPAV